jgi:DNA-binding NarL/FixJ family response regulator
MRQPEIDLVFLLYNGVTGRYDMAAPIKLLVVDDHNLFRHGLVGLLSDLPDFLIVGEASNGPDAVELCRQRRPDVVLMDVHMPGGNGVEAARILK